MYFHIILGTQWVGHSKLWCFCSLSIISSSSVSGTSVIHMLTLSNWSSYYLFSHIFHLFVLFLGRFLQHCLQTLPLNLLANFQFQRTISLFLFSVSFLRHPILALCMYYVCTSLYGYSWLLLRFLSTLWIFKFPFSYPHPHSPTSIVHFALWRSCWKLSSNVWYLGLVVCSY